MQFNVSRLLKECVGAERHHHLDDDTDPLQETGTDHVAGDLRFIRTEEGVWVNGLLHVNATSVCSRCLEPYPHTMEFTVDDVWYPLVDVDTGARLRLPDKDVFTIDPSHVLDLREAIRQYAVTSVPMKPLCGPDCPGICPSCGAQLKCGECTCSRPQRDVRWGALLHLLAKEQR